MGMCAVVALCPINFDRQCGVINDKGLPCSRSLTCKTHTVGAKRGVQGRTRAYDLLYLEWQRANNPNFKEPASKKDKEPHRPIVPGAGTVLTKKKSTTRRDIDEETLALDKGGLEELIHCARVAGERLCRPYGSGSGSGMMGGGDNREKASVWKVASYEFALVGDMLTKALAARPKVQPGAAGSTKVGPGTGVKGLGTGMGLGMGMDMGLGMGIGVGMGPTGTMPMMNMGGGYGDNTLSGGIFPVPA